LKLECPIFLITLQSRIYPSSFIPVEIPLEKMVYCYISTANCTPDISGYLIINWAARLLNNCKMIWQQLTHYITLYFESDSFQSKRKMCQHLFKELDGGRHDEITMDWRKPGNNSISHFLKLFYNWELGILYTVTGDACPVFVTFVKYYYPSLKYTYLFWYSIGEVRLFVLFHFANTVSCKK
jgi:hypothetical protein